VDKNGEPDKSAAKMFAVRSSNPELARHVGQEVELSGRLIPSSAAGSGGSSAGAGSRNGSTTTSTSSTAASGTSGAADNGSMQNLEVQTIRMIASVCAAR